MLDNLESRITFEVPTSLDFDKLIRDNNYTLFWQNLQSHQDLFRGSLQGESHGEYQDLPDSVNVHSDRNSSSFNLMSSLKHFAGEGADDSGLRFSRNVSVAGVSKKGLDILTSESFIYPGYLWIGAMMALLLISGLFCVCSCYLYLKYKKWKKTASVRAGFKCGM
ncbi:protein commissureless 2 homolog isoform X2 [Uranotaenia lowii]|uniref:protein commissureless 2 homolog isoform X2 n=1 Tax=Uranotaenia lowii TaxID=190385 RepID=UPI0024791E0B|nr:protein commissureless 2 homolog isoform X2 [Uranotaenia lowii]